MRITKYLSENDSVIWERTEAQLISLVAWSFAWFLKCLNLYGCIAAIDNLPDQTRPWANGF